MAGVAACFGLGPADGCCLTLRLHGELKKTGIGCGQNIRRATCTKSNSKNHEPKQPVFPFGDILGSAAALWAGLLELARGRPSGCYHPVLCLPNRAAYAHIVWSPHPRASRVRSDGTVPGGRELLYAQGFPWEDIVFFIAVCFLCESKNDYVWDNRGQFQITQLVSQEGA